MLTVVQKQGRCNSPKQSQRCRNWWKPTTIADGCINRRCDAGDKKSWGDDKYAEGKEGVRLTAGYRDEADEANY